MQNKNLYKKCVNAKNRRQWDGGWDSDFGGKVQLRNDDQRLVSLHVKNNNYIKK
jgi:hypothetical protein